MCAGSAGFAAADGERHNSRPLRASSMMSVFPCPTTGEVTMASFSSSMKWISSASTRAVRARFTRHSSLPSVASNATKLTSRGFAGFPFSGGFGATAAITTLPPGDWRAHKTDSD
jgi:hypothetical protein